MRLLLLDLDGTVRRCTVPGQPCPNGPGESELLPGAAEAVGAALAQGAAIGFVTNQGGVGLGYFSEADCRAAIEETRQQLSEALGRPLTVSVHVCTHAPYRRCRCRKPKPGLLIAAMKRHGVKPQDCLMVGDRPSDRQAATAARVRFLPAEAWRAGAPMDG